MGTKRGSSRMSVLFERMRKLPMKVKIFCGALLALCALVALKFTITSNYYYFIASESVHIVGIIALIYKLFALKTCSGIFPFPHSSHHTVHSYISKKNHNHHFQLKNFWVSFCFLQFRNLIVFVTCCMKKMEKKKI